MLHPLAIAGLLLPHNVMLAPLAGITNHVFRLVCRYQGASLAFTEMISANGMVREGVKTLALLASSPDDCPLGVQIFGESPELLAQSAVMVEHLAGLIDINMGCPVRKVVGTGAGSALLKDPAQIANIIRSVRKATTLPLTVKIRSGWNCGDNTWLTAGQIAEAEGCDAITLHPRSRNQMFGGKSDWQKIAALKKIVKIPVIGSGDLFTPEDCKRMLEETGCDGVMIARGALGNPWIFQQTMDLLEGRIVTPVTLKERADMVAKHLDMYCHELGEAVAVREMKKHLGWYLRGLPGAGALRKAVNSSSDKEELVSLVAEIRQTGG